MPSSSDIFDELNSSGIKLHGIIRPDPASSDHVLFSSHAGITNSVRIPVDQIRSATKNGTLRGLGSEYHSVDMVLNKAIESNGEVFPKILSAADKPLIQGINPVYCYDENGNWVPCP